ncbi:MAG: Trk system potassium transporter TrkA [Ruminococcaceae bacterium]|nr:Trk system potassium transporter TrkA [Oscillospiraceae bacterium]
MLQRKKAKGLNIIIVGCGRVGITLVEQLSAEGHSITVIDKDKELIEELINFYDIMGVVGNGASFSMQMEAGIKDADLIIAVTESDELNLLCCTVARRVGNCAAIARVRNPDYSLEIDYLRNKLGLAMIINPELEASREMARVLLLPTALDVNSFAHGQAELVKFKVKEQSMLNGMTVAEVGAKTNNALICAVERKGKIYIPWGDFVMEAGDSVSVAAPRKMVKEFFKTVGINTHHVNDAMIIGGGDSAYYLARQLHHMGIGVKIIEKDKERCEELSVLLPKSIIINGDGTDEDLLREEGIETVESFIPLTGSDEENILLTLYANKVSNAKVITKINRLTFNDVIDGLDLGSVIYPRYITTEAIIAYVRAKSASRSNSIETLYHMFSQRAEAIEFRVDEEHPGVTGKPLMDLKLKKNVLIAFINRKGKIIIPGGKDAILPGDTVMIVTTNKGFNDITDILA